MAVVKNDLGNRVIPGYTGTKSNNFGFISSTPSTPSTQPGYTSKLHKTSIPQRITQVTQVINDDKRRPRQVGKARILLDQSREIEDAHEVQQEGTPQGGPKAPITSALGAGNEPSTGWHFWHAML
jgi:hypothetical protein